jgi:hypothetical protein
MGYRPALRPSGRDHEEDAGPLRTLHHGLGVSQRQRQRLLAENMLAAGEGDLRLRSVQVRWQTQVNERDVHLVQQLFERDGYRHIQPEFTRTTSGRLIVGISNAHNLHPRMQSHTPGVRLPHEAEPCDGHVDHRHYPLELSGSCWREADACVQPPAAEE